MERGIRLHLKAILRPHSRGGVCIELRMSDIAGATVYRGIHGYGVELDFRPCAVLEAWVPCENGGNMAAGEITQLLSELRAGNRDAESELVEAVYPELRRLAARLLRSERPGHTLQTTGLVNEAYLRLLGHANLDWKDRAHFFAAAAQSMRRILVDYGRKRRADKREGGRQQVELTEALAISDDRLDLVVAIDQLLTRLSEWDALQCRVVELRFFGGLTEDEVAEVLGIGSRTVSREWSLARAWLHGELKRAADHDTHVKR
jgi:RNA polymerase sigma-70 factor, ECF subfamily